MEAKGISIVCCALAALTLSACSGDSQPTGPEAGGLNRQPYPGTYSGPTAQPTYEGDVASPDGSTPPTYEQPPGDGSGGTTGMVVSHPIEKFLASQGTFCADDGMGGCDLYMRPTANYLGWFNQSYRYSAAVDYAGIANNWLVGTGRWLGTQIGGAVTEEQLVDGRARVTIDLHGTNVLSFVTSGSSYQNPTVFGAQPRDLVDPSTIPAVGHVQMKIVLTNPAMGMPLPDLMQLIRQPQPGQKLESLVMRYEGDGQMSTGESRHIQIVYDGSLGPIYPSHPASPSDTPVMGTAMIALL
jgi:hypothetical protein